MNRTRISQLNEPAYHIPTNVQRVGELPCMASYMTTERSKMYNSARSKVGRQHENSRRNVSSDRSNVCTNIWRPSKLWIPIYHISQFLKIINYMTSDLRHTSLNYDTIRKNHSSSTIIPRYTRTTAVWRLYNYCRADI